MAVLFALVHVPGFYLRGGEQIARQAQGLGQIIALAIGAIASIAVTVAADAQLSAGGTRPRRHRRHAGGGKDDPNLELRELAQD
jgi:hypothetical protein